MSKLLSALSRFIDRFSFRNRIVSLLERFPRLNLAIKMAVRTAYIEQIRVTADDLTEKSDRTPYFFVDVSDLTAKKNHSGVYDQSHSGVHEVTGNLLRELLNSPPVGMEVKPVADWGRGYFYLDAALEFQTTPIAVRAGDIFFRLDWMFFLVPKREDFFILLRELDVKVYFLIHDLLPLTMPQSYSGGTDRILRLWLATISRVASGNICISRSVADDYLAYLRDNPPKRSTPLKVGVSHHGVDRARFEARPWGSAPNPAGDAVPRPRIVSQKIEKTYLSFQAEPEKINNLSNLLTCNPGVRGTGSPAGFGGEPQGLVPPTFLMVGALSPRKGYREALEAFEILWASGYDFNLVIVGKSGWKANDIAADIKSHRELGRRLFWFEGASDEVLAVLYKNASALIAASHAEGFGLPLIEAARMGLPLIARDIAVFREVAGEGAFYFPDGGAAALASAILRWHALALEGREPKPSDVKSLSWAESAENLKGIIIDGNWYAEFGGRGDG